jgi:hypothetical protein
LECNRCTCRGNRSSRRYRLSPLPSEPGSRPTCNAQLGREPLGGRGDFSLELSDSTWVPSLLFVYLGCFFLQKAIRRGAKQSWSWGRGGGPVAVSRWGYASWAASFFAIAFIITQAPKPPPASVALLMACFLTTLGVGCLDTHRHNKAQRTSESPGNRNA